MTTSQLSLLTDKEMPWESRHSPKLTVRSKYEPYDALRQRFWRQYLTQYDADDTGAISYTELTTMLDSLGSTLTKRTLEGYFSSCGKNAQKDELTVEEVILCLEKEVTKSRAEKEKVMNDDLVSTDGDVTPAISAFPAGHGLDMTGPDESVSSPVDPDELAEHIKKSAPRKMPCEGDDRPGNMRPALVDGTSNESIPNLKVEPSEPSASTDSSTTPMEGRELITTPSGPSDSGPSEADADEDETSDDRERIINIRTCPLCHRPRLGKRSEQDIVTHLAICASADWSRVDRIVTANYVTSSQAQRKFFTKLVNKVAIGAYSLGANSANILVQDRTTGQLQEEKMAVSFVWEPQDASLTL